jgi:maleylpyruvate isomerase
MLQMRLYTYWRSSSAWRVRIALAWKRLPYESIAVNLAPGHAEQHTPGFVEKNAMAQLPVLELEPAPGGAQPRRIAQSMAILEYLEEQHPQPPLLPSDPWLRARARQLAELVNSGIQPLQNLSVTEHVKSALGGDGSAWIRHFMSHGLAALEHSCQETTGAYLVGDAPSFADVYLVPQLYAGRRFGVDLTPYPTLLRVETTCAALPAFAAAHADRQADKPAAQAP